MKINLKILQSQITFILFFIFLFIKDSAIAQTPAANTMGSIDKYIWGSIVLIIVAALITIQKANKILAEHGQTIIDEDSNTFFKRMAKSGKKVAIIMALAILCGIYFVITYKAA